MLYTHVIGRVSNLTAGNDVLACSLRPDQLCWLPDFWAKLSSLNIGQKQCLSLNFAHSMIGKPNSSIPWDMCIKMMMNKGSKMKADWL